MLLSVLSYGEFGRQSVADFTLLWMNSTAVMVKSICKETWIMTYLCIIGPIFRVSPNELSFASATSWKSIYGHPGAGKPTLIKSEFYNMYGSGFDSLCIGSERDPKVSLPSRYVAFNL